MSIFKESNGAVTFAVKVIPRASKNQIAGVEGEAIKIRLRAPPVDGQANKALIEFLADALNLPRANIEIVTGQTSRHKIVRVRGATAKQIEAKIKM